MNAYETAAKYLAIIQKAGARHSAKDTDLVQQMHDRACELGAKCKCEEVTVHPTLRAAVEALILRHGTHDQKAHGRRHGVGGLREVAGKSGHRIKQGTDKHGKTFLTITHKDDKRIKMRAGGITEAKRLIVSSNKFRRESAKKRPASAVEQTLTRTKRQRNKDIKTLSEMPLEKLRQHQDLIGRQLTMAHAQGNTRAMEALQARENDVMAAIMRRLK